jgi:hypothetical protein
MHELMSAKDKFWFLLGFVTVTPLGLATLNILVLVVWAVFNLPAWYPVLAVPGVSIAWFCIWMSITDV